MSRPSRILAVVALFTGTLGVSSPVAAAEFTDLLDAADDKDDFSEETYDPFDFNLEPSFSFESGKAEITREAPCVNDSSETNADNPRLVTDPGRCVGSSGAGIVENKELLYRRQETQLDFTGRIGIYKDLEFRFNIPFVLGQSHAMKYANEQGQTVDSENSSVDPSDARIEDNADNVFGGTSRGQARGRLGRFQNHRFFDVGSSFDDSEFTRSGLGDPSIGIGWAPYNDQRDDTKATMVLGMDYTMPVAKIKKRENPDAVGEGKHKLSWRFASSKQFDWIDPYFGMEYTLQLAARDSPIKNLADIDPDNEGQDNTLPPQKGELTIGTEFVPHEVETPDEHERYAIDLNFTFGYTSEGRDYTPLFDHLTRSDCNGRTVSEVLPNYDGNGDYEGPGGVRCSWLAQRAANAQPNPTYGVGQLDGSQTLQTNGIMTVESYATFAGQLGVYLQPTRYFQFKLQGGITHQQEHFLTNASTGNDVDDSREQTEDDNVDLTGQDAEIERNPAYNSTYDSPGTRFRINEYNTWNLMVTLAAQF